MLSKFAEQWTTPTGIMIIFGCVVWGVQLNMAVMSLNERVTAASTRTGANESALVVVSQNNLKTALIIEHLQTEVAEVVEKSEEHSKEAEEWKRRITVLEQKAQL